MKYFGRKFGFFLLTLWAVVTLNFLIPRLQPGDPAELMVKALAGKDAQLDPAQVLAMRAMLGTPTDRCGTSTGSTSPAAARQLRGLLHLLPVQVTEVIGQAFWWTVILVSVDPGLRLHRSGSCSGRLRRGGATALRLGRHRSARPSSAPCNRSGSLCCCSTCSATRSAGSRPAAATRSRPRVERRVHLRGRLARASARHHPDDRHADRLDPRHAQHHGHEPRRGLHPAGQGQGTARPDHRAQVRRAERPAPSASPASPSPRAVCWAGRSSSRRSSTIPASGRLMGEAVEQGLPVAAGADAAHHRRRAGRQPARRPALRRARPAGRRAAA